MVTYKGFNVYYCDPDTYENLQFVRRFELCITSRTGNITNSYNIDESTILTRLQNAGIDNTVISGLIMLRPTYNNIDRIISELQAICPLAVRNFANETGQICKVKLEASDGKYAISVNGVANGDASFGSGQEGNYYLYNADGTQVSTQPIPLTSFGASNVTFIALQNYNGVVQPTNDENAITIDSLAYYQQSTLYNIRKSYTYISQAHADWLNSITPFPPEPTDPYTPGGNSDVSEPNGDFDVTSDPIDFPTLPTLGAVDSGFITLFNPELTELQALARYMWTNPLFDISAWKKVFADPMDAILGLSIVPVSVPDGSSRPITVGNIVTDVSMKVATAQFIEVQCGSLNVNEFWSGYLDYEPHTKAEIYLPFCGVHQISVDDIMNKTVEVRYHVDILSGACCAYVKCGDSVLYQFIGQCSSNIPISGSDFTNVINGVMSAATAIGSLVATGGASAPLAVPALSSTALNALKPNIEKSGAMGGTGGMLAIQKPYLVLTRPKQAHPENQNHYTGYPSFITENLGDLSGYTEIEKIHLEGVPATDDELNEIESLLKGGVIL